METTLFSIVPEHISNKFKEYGFYYDDLTYINIFRWLWNEKHIHPKIDCFPQDEKNLCLIGIYQPHLRKNTNLTGSSYDDAIIKTVEFIYDNIDLYLIKDA